MIRFLLNDAPATTSSPPSTPVLDVIRGEHGLAATKEGCREGDCGACTVLLGRRTAAGVRYLAVNSCILPAGELRSAHLVTLEGLEGSVRPTLVQEALVAENASQCGFCTPGMVMSLTGYLLGGTPPTVTGAVRSLDGNLCRCTGYASVRRAAAAICAAAGGPPAAPPGSPAHLDWLIDRRILPEWFRRVPDLLDALPVPDTAASGGDGPAIAIAGGTDLMAQGAAAGGRLRFLSREAGMDGIVLSDGECVLGAAATLTDLLESPLPGRIPGLAGALEVVASTQVRNRATVGGNLVNASPIADLAVILLALGAVLTLEEDGARRSLPLASFFLGYKRLDLAPGGLLRTVSLPLPGAADRFSFEKVSTRRHLDIAAVNSAALLRIVDGRIVRAAVSAGGVAPVPLLLRRTSALLEGREPGAAAAGEAARAAMGETSPIDDVRGSAEYRRRLLGRLVAAHVLGEAVR